MEMLKKISVFTFGLIILTGLCFGITETGQAQFEQPYFYNTALQSFIFDMNINPEDFRSFSPEGQTKLSDMVANFTQENNRELDYISNLRFGDSNMSAENKEFDFQLFPGLLLETNYIGDEEDYQVNLDTKVNLEYYMNDNILITANYNIFNQRINNINNEFQFTENPEDRDDDLTDFTRKEDKKGQLGIVYQSSDKLTLSADIFNNNLRNINSGFSTGFGLEYSDDIGDLRARYLYDIGEDYQESSTGLELDLKNLARISASYELFNPDLITKWDFGLDINLTDLSSFSLGYELINPGDNYDVNMGKQKSNIEANFQINF